MGRTDYTWLAVLLANGYNIIDSVKKFAARMYSEPFLNYVGNLSKSLSA